MIDAEVNYLDDEITVNEQEPSSYAECTAILGSEQAAVKEIVDNVRYRNKHPRVYRLVSKELSDKHSMPRTVKSEKEMSDGTKRPIYESHINHLRVCYKKNSKLVTEVLSRIAMAESLYVKGERTGLGGRISQSALDMANGFFAQGEDVVEDKVSVIEGLMTGYKIDRDEDKAVTVESLARGIQALDRQLKRQATEQTKAALA